ncbi:MAG: DUF4493 domain-containing protein [Bacteroidales bacterium]|nr:DUF4493 domain-containing protein [Bacteroidales bacterium]
MFINPNISFKAYVRTTGMMLAVLAGLFVSCAQIEENNAGKTAYLDFSAISVDYTVENLTPTKASVPDSDLPEAGDFTIRISGQGGEPIVYEPGTLPSEVVLAPGEYTVEAVYGENTFGEPYFYKSVQVSLLPEDKKTVPLTDITLENAMLAVTLPDDFGTHLTVSSIVVSDSKGGSMNIETGRYVYVPSGSEVYVTFNGTNSAGQNKSIKVTLGTLKPQCAYNIVCNLDLPTLSFADQRDGAWAGRLYLTSLATSDKAIDMSALKYMLSSDGGVSWAETVPEPKDGYWLISGLDENKTYSIKAVLGELVSNSWTFEPTESSSLALSLAHTKDSSGNLDGTKATVSGDVPYPSRLAGLISSKGSYGAELTDAGGNVVRTLSAKAGEMAVANNWPYLPQGTYTLKSYYQIGEEKVYLTANPSAVSPAPVFTVKANAETSYSRYLAGSSNKNDSGTGDKVMNISASVSISDVVLGNGNYSGKKTVSLTYDGISMLTSDALTSRSVVPTTLVGNESIFTNGNVINQAWGTHTLSASVTFDGITSSSSIQCHVTGIPYSYDFVDGSLDQYRSDGWSTNGTLSVTNQGLVGRDKTLVLTDTKVSGSEKSGFVVSPKFFIPEHSTIYVQPSIIRSVYSTANWGSGKTRTGYVGPVSSTTSSSTAVSYTTSGGTSIAGTEYGGGEWLTAFGITESSPYISISCDLHGKATGAYYFLHEAHFRYN